MNLLMISSEIKGAPKNPVPTFIGVVFFYVLLSALVMGANPFRGGTSAPMDILLAKAGWQSVGEEGAIRHPERSDVLDALLPQWTQLKRDIKDGGTGLWNPLTSGGRPGILDFTQSELTPSFFLFALINEDWLGFYFAGLVKLVIAGLGAFLFLRLFIGTPSALFGGAVYTFIGFHSAWFYWPHVSTSAWIPWLLWSVAGWHLYLKARWCLMIVLTAIMLILGGMPAVAAYGFYSAALLAALFPIVVKTPLKKSLKVFSVTFISIGIAFLISAIPLLGFYEVLSSFIDLEGRRSRQNSGISMNEWMLFIDPYVDGLPKVERTLFSGKIALLLAFLSVIALIARQFSGHMQRLLALFGSALLVISVGIAFGLFPNELVRSVPGIGSSSWARLVVITGLSIAILASLALHMIILKCRNIKVTQVRRGALFFVIFIAVLQIYEQAVLFRKFNAVVTKNVFLPSTPSIAYVKENISELQSVIADSSFLVSGTLGSYGISEWFAHEFRSAAEKELLSKVVIDPFRSATAASFDSTSIQLDSPLLAKLGVAFILVGKNLLMEQRLGGHKPAPPLPDNQLSQIVKIEQNVLLSAVSLVLATYKADSALSDVVLDVVDHAGRVVASSVAKAASVKDNKATIFEFDKPVLLLPARYELQIQLINPASEGKLTVWYVDTPTNKNDLIKVNGEITPGAMVYKLWGSIDYNKSSWEAHKLEQNILVLKNRHVPKGAYFVDKLNDDAAWSDAHTRTVRLGSDSLQISYAGNSPGYIVLPMRSFPGWQAFVNGRMQNVVSYLGVLPAVHVDGPSSVDFRYKPEWFSQGVVLMITGVFLLLLLLGILMRSATSHKLIPQTKIYQ